MPTPETMTARQQAWLAAVRDNLVADTGRTLDQWAEIARTCPETKHRARLNWLKAQHGLGQNRASVVLDAAFPSDTGWGAPDALADALWADPALRAIFEAAKAEIAALPDIVVGQRKGYTAFSRRYQFAALRPAKGVVLLGLAVPPDDALGLFAPTRIVWSERLTSQATLATAVDVAPLAASIHAAWATS